MRWSRLRLQRWAGSRCDRSGFEGASAPRPLFFSMSCRGGAKRPSSSLEKQIASLPLFKCTGRPQDAPTVFINPDRKRHGRTSHFHPRQSHADYARAPGGGSCQPPRPNVRSATPSRRRLISQLSSPALVWRGPARCANDRLCRRLRVHVAKARRSRAFQCSAHSPLHRPGLAVLDQEGRRSP